MDRRCKEFEETLATLAEGGTDAAAAAHVEGCQDCTDRVTELRKVVQGARLERHNAPTDLVARAQALMSSSRRRLIARLLGSSLAAAGARSSRDESFSLHLGAEDWAVRLQYTPVNGAWEIAGRAPAEGWKLVQGGATTDCGAAGRFRFTAPDLPHTGFLLQAPDAEIAVPPALELLNRAS